MYHCSICGKEVEVDHINKPVCCPGATIYAGLSGEAHGFGSMSLDSRQDNLSPATAPLFSQMIQYMVATEIFKNGKDNIFVKDFKIKDTETGREFKLNLKIEGSQV